MISTLFGRENSSPSTSATNYMFMSGGSLGSWNATESNRDQVMPAAFDLSELYVQLDTAPGAGKSWEFAVMKNGVVTGQTVTISDTATSGTSAGATASFVADDTISLRSVPTGTPTSTNNVYWNVKVSGTGFPFIYSNTLNPNTTILQYDVPNGNSNTFATGDTRYVVAPTAGTIDDWYIKLSAAPGGSTDYKFTLMKNGVATALTITIGGVATSGNNTADSVSFVAGDYLSVEIDPSASAPATTNVAWGMLVTPTTDGESFYPYGSNDPPSTSATEFEMPIGNGRNGWTGTEADHQIIPGPYTMKKFYGIVGTAPSSGKSWQFTVRKAGADTALVFTIADTATTGNNTNDVAVSQGEKLAVESTPSGTPTAMTNGAHLGILIYVAPAATDYTEDPADTVTVTDAAVKTVGKNVADTASVADVVAKTITLAFADGVAITDSATKNAGKNAADVVTVTDAANKNMGKNIADAVTLADAAVKTFGKNVADSVTVADVFDRAVDYVRAITDAVATTDAAIKNVGKNIADTVTTNDQADTQIVVSLNFADGVTVRDTTSNLVVEVGSYTGNATSRSITGLGFQPTALLIKGGSQPWHLATNTMSAGNIKQMTGAVAPFTGAVTSLDADGFTLGTHNSVNQNAVVFHYIALRDDGGATMKVTSYLGDGVNPHAITGIGFRPDLILFAPRSADTPGFRTSDMPTDAYFRPEDFGNLTNRVESLDADGFTLNSTNEVNKVATNYDIVCLKNTASIFKVLTFTGNGVDDRVITGVGFQPDAVFVRNGAEAQVMAARFKDETGDNSYLVNANGEAANRIQAFASDGFEVGSADTVNKNTQAFYTFSFKEAANSTAIAKSIGKNQADIITVLDAANKNFSKALADAVTIVDAASKNVGKVVSDNVTITDNRTNTIGKTLSDGVVTSDSAIKNVGKFIVDTVIVTDSASLSLATIPGTDPVGIILEDDTVSIVDDDTSAIVDSGEQEDMLNDDTTASLDDDTSAILENRITNQ